jgi:hypothetical protein
MAMGVLSGFNTTRHTTTAATTITSTPSYVCARLIAGAAAAKMRVFNGSTAATAQVAILSCSAANTADELSVPIRCPDGVRVLMSVNTATAFIYTR